jgi:hypothetical protein
MSNLVPLFVDKDTGDVVATTDVSRLIPTGAAFGFYYHQQFDSDVWVVTHDKETMAVVCQVYSTDLELVLPDSIVIDSANQITITFSTAMSGFAHLILFKLG